jgi:peptidoglycan/LPS O-acetylase OafA/YrhL
LSAAPLKALFNREIPAWSYFLFVQNFIMAHRQTFGAHWIATTWSLAIEEQFYLLLPLFIRNLSARGITWIALAAILGAPAVRLIFSASGNPYMGPYTLLPCRADSLAFGVLAALVCRNADARKWLAAHRKYLYGALLLSAGGFASLAHYEKLLYNVGLTWIDAFYAVLLLLAVVNPGRMEAGFRIPVLMKLGTVSYAVYIFHLGINELAHFAISGKDTSLADGSSVLITLGSLIVVISLSALSWRLFENPLIRHAHRAYRY